MAFVKGKDQIVTPRVRQNGYFSRESLWRSLGFQEEAREKICCLAKSQEFFSKSLYEPCVP